MNAYVLPRRKHYNDLVFQPLEFRCLLTSVTRLTPLPNSHVEPRAAEISATFDAEINADSISPASFVVRGMQTGHAIPSPVVEGDRITLSPRDSFRAGELVQVTATNNVASRTGEPLSDPAVWQFRTATNRSTGIFGNPNQNGNALTAGIKTHLRFSRDLFGDVALGDIDGDGDLDAFVADIGECGDAGCYYGGADRVWFNDGSGRFSDSGQRLGDQPSDSVAIGDIDGDGDLDAIVTTSAYLGLGKPDSNKIWRNNGDGQFTDSGQVMGKAADIVLGDIDGDGDLDAVTDRDVWINDSRGTFSQHQTFHHDGGAVAIGDVDNDGDLDAFVIASSDTDLNLWLNDGRGNFAEGTQKMGIGEGDTSAIALGDVDNDGDLDLFTGHNRANKVWLNDGKGHFVDSGQLLGDDDTNAVELGDIDGDGDLDAFVVNLLNGNRPEATSRSGNNKVWLNDGAGNFTDSGQDRHGLGISSYSGVLVLGDLDADGDLDVIVDNLLDLRVLKNQDHDLLAGDANQDGTFDSTDLVAVFQAGEYEDEVADNSTIEEGDWNGDGEFDSSDLVLAFQQGNYLNTAQVNFLIQVSTNSLFESSSDDDEEKNEERVLLEDIL